MVRITKVHTGGGDGGETSLVDGTRVGKENPRVGVYGTIDEANSAIGIVRAEISRLKNPGVADESLQPLGDRLIEADNMLGIIQQELFDVGAECACPPGGVPEQMSVIGTERIPNQSARSIFDYKLVRARSRLYRSHCIEAKQQHSTNKHKHIALSYRIF